MLWRVVNGPVTKKEVKLESGQEPSRFEDIADLSFYDILIIIGSVSLFIGFTMFVLSFFPQTKGEYTCAQFQRDAEINPQLYINTAMTDVVMRCQDSL